MEHREFRGMGICPTSAGYPRVYWPEHPESMSGGCVYVHRVVALEKFGYIPDGHHVHHVNNNAWDWSEDNIDLLCASCHARLHNEKMDEKKCALCGGSFRPDKARRKYCSRICYARSMERIDWPDSQYLSNRALEIGFSALSRELGVSDNAIRKRISRFS